MRIVIISYLMHPSNEIGAVRPTNLARWLARFGHDVTIITGNPNAKEDGLLKVVVLKNSSLYTNIRNRLSRKRHMVDDVQKQPHYIEVKEKKTSILRYARNHSVYFDWFMMFRKWAVDNSELLIDSDIVISSYGPICNLMAGYFVKTRKLTKRWISDYRDLLTYEGYGAVLNSVLKNFTKVCLRSADFNLFISKGMMQIMKNLGVPKVDERAEVVYNGYEMDTDIPTQNGMSEDLEAPLRIGYTGALYAGRRDIGAVFLALSNLKKLGRLIRRVEVHYAGPDSELFMQCADRLSCTSMAIDHGLLSRTESIALQASCDALCVLTWNTTEQRGIIPGKLFEYLVHGKPIIGVVSGSVTSAEVSEIIRVKRLGVSYEEGNHDEDIVELESFLERLVSSPKTHTFFTRESVAEFRYDRIVRKIEEIIEYSIVHSATSKRGDGEV